MGGGWDYSVMCARAEGPLSSDQADELFACLSSIRRRTLVRLLDGESTMPTMRAAARALADREGTTTPEGDPPRRERAVAISLVHVHLPKLVDADVVTVDDDTDRIHEGPHFETAVALLERARSGPLDE